MKINSFILQLTIAFCACCVMSLSPLYAQVDTSKVTYQLEFHLLRYKADSIVIPAVYIYHPLGTDSTEDSPRRTYDNGYYHVDSTFSTITIKVFNHGTNTLRYVFSNIPKDSLAYVNSKGSGKYLLKGLTPSSSQKLDACVYRDSETAILFKQDFFAVYPPPTRPPFVDFPIGTVLPTMYLAKQSYLEMNGWFICDGRRIDTLPYLSSSEKDTLVTLQFVSGKPNPYHLPDLRGYFLRGVDGGSGNDPGHAARTGIGSKLGGIQEEDFKSHNHTQTNHQHTGTTDMGGMHRHNFSDISWSENRPGGLNNLIGSSGTDNDNSHYTTSSTTSASDGLSEHTHSFTTSTAVGGAPTIQHNGGNETRPKNIGVYYIIKVRQ